MRDLIARFDAVVKDHWGPHSAPTVESVAAINRRLGVELPRGLLEFARHSNSFSSFFLGLGADYEEHSHIIIRNEHWRAQEAALPPSLVMFTDGFMDDDFFCFDTQRPSRGEYVIQYWAPDVDPSEFGDTYPDFRAFITSTVEWYEGKRA